MLSELVKESRVQSRRELLGSCDLSCDNTPRPSSRIGSFSIDEAKPEAMVSNDTILSIVAGMSRENKVIVRRTIQFCSLVASSDHPRGGVAWFKRYEELMALCGWVSPEWSTTDYRASNTHLTMEKVALDILKSTIIAAALPGPAAAVLLKIAGDTVDALKGDDKPLRLFEQSSKTPNGAKFAIAASAQSPEGDVVMAMGAVNVRTSLNITNVLFWEWSRSEVAIQRAENVMELFPESYEDVRDIVESKLKEYQRKTLLEIKLKG
ncbi:hypothetical protein [Pseudomonas syringae]|uniref:hypothetical protein n=1 Tax=Pseudomonas syringae TaxID=317 RepID=UPI00067DA590|nr:hypothetical protein [Pseudomonas syringae]